MNTKPTTNCDRLSLGDCILTLLWALAGARAIYAHVLPLLLRVGVTHPGIFR